MKAMTTMLRQTAWVQTLVMSALVPGMILMPMPAHSNPTGAAVVHGAVEIDDTVPGHLKINQGSNKAIINWQDFSIGAGELTEFIQPGVDAVALNRVISGNPSTLLGTLSANGGVILVNPNGILVGGGGVIDVGGLMALSTLDIDDADFLDGGTMTFKGDSAAGVTNLGTITSRGGDVVLLGNFVDNQGAVGAPDGTVAFGAGGEFIVDSVGESRLSVVAGGPGGETGISNSGEVSAAAVEFKAHGNVYALAIQNTGIVRANGVSRQGGRIILSAAGDGSVGGRIENSGDLIARGPGGAGGEILIDGGPGGQVDILGGRVDADGDNGADGGTITMLGDIVNVTGDSRVSADGANGGSVQIGSKTGTSAITVGPDASVSANGETGNGGVVQVLGNQSSVINVFGQVSADGAQGGGLVQMSGGTVTTHEGSVVSANGGETGGQVQFVGNGINSVTVNGTVSATGGEGGRVTVGADQVTTGANSVIDVSGEAVGGMVVLDGDSAINVNGAVNANGTSGDGGRVLIHGSQGVNVGGAARLEADGLGGQGGDISVDSETNTEMGGEASAQGGDGVGGTIDVTGEDVLILGSASLDASGSLGGGEVNVGGGFQGGVSRLRNSNSTVVEAGAQFAADAVSDGDGGQVVIWSDGATAFDGSASARTLGGNGNGGLIEVSGKSDLEVGIGSSFVATAANGSSGTVLFDPGDVIVGAAGSSDIAYETINNTLQGGTSVIIATEADALSGLGNIEFTDLGLGNDRHGSLQWTNSLASFGAFAAGNIIVTNSIRTSGAGSVNLLAGWTGTEGDAQILANNPEAAWDYYVENGQFGNLGSVIMGDSGGTRFVSVGSRYGNTNVAGQTLLMLTPEQDSGESDYIHLGFRDTGQIFAVRGNGGFANNAFDLNDRDLETENDPIVGIYDPAYFRDINGDTIPDGVYAINSSGVLDEDNLLTGGDADGNRATNPGNPTLIPFANHFTDERQGNWWWQQIDAQNPDPIGLGGNLPEHGAGGYDRTTGAVDSSVRADINVVTKSAVVMQGGGRHQNYVQIGHGGDSTAWADDRGLRDGNQANNISGQNSRNYTFNGARDYSGTSIARLAPVYGNINVYAGVNTDQAIDIDHDAGVISATTDSAAGLVQLRGWQNTASANNLNNPEQGNNSESYVQIGHLGTGQFGSAYGDIAVQAGGDVEVLAGAHTRNHATIGHTMNGYVDWNVTSNERQQIRFFHNVGDHDNPNMRKGELFSDGLGGAGRGFYDEDTQGSRWDDDFYDATVDYSAVNAGSVGNASTGTPGLSASGPVQIEALTGGVRNTLAGDIRVEAGGPNGITIKGYTNPDTRTLTTDENPVLGNIDGDDDSARFNNVDDAGDADGLRFARDRRFAGIGHGGSSFDQWSSLDNERVRLRVVDGDGTGTSSASVEEGGTDNGSRIGRAVTFLNIVGDIEVIAENGDIKVHAGNDTFDYAYIGHGGNDLGDYETSNVVIGDITVRGGGDLEVFGAGVLATYTGAANRNFHSHAQIGHHGRENGMQYYAGDINVEMGGDITLTAGRYRESGAKIGHQSAVGYGQVGGDFTRQEEFIYGGDLGTTPITTDVTVTSSDVTIVFDDGVTEVTEVFAIDGYTANVQVSAGGNLTMDHGDAAPRETQNMYAFDNYNTNTNGNTNIDNDLHDTRWSHTQIGHGGNNTGTFRTNQGNTAYNFYNKTGDVTVNVGTETLNPDGTTTVTGGDLFMQNGTGQDWWTVIGHVFGDTDRSDGGTDIDQAWKMIGDVTVNALGDITMDAGTPEVEGRSGIQLGILDDGTVRGAGQIDNRYRAQFNMVGIGHQATWNNLDIVVLDDGTLVNGIAADSDIIVTSGGNLEMNAGDDEDEGGYRGAPVRIGHGATSDRGNDAFRPAGFSGDIDVFVEGDLVMQGGSNAHVSDVGEEEIHAFRVEGQLAQIGHGGYTVDNGASLTGNINVYVGNDLTMTAGQRTEAAVILTNDDNNVTDDPGGDAAVDNTEITANADPLGAFTRIGHGSMRTRDGIDGVNSTGDINLVVGNDMTMTGGTGVQVGGFNQVGHGGPDVNGNMSGDVTVLVGNNLTTVDGDAMDPDTRIGGLNYNKIGHGDWMFESPIITFDNGQNPQNITNLNSGSGDRDGNINVLVGESATLDHSLVGHADPDVQTSFQTISQDSNTYFAVSRNYPFTRNATGSLTAENGTIFSSGFYGFGSELRIYIPRRSLNLMDTTTRLNESINETNPLTYAGTPGDFVGLDVSQGEFAGREDEVYLQPDLWWDNEGLSEAIGSMPFPTDAVSGQGGAIAEVESPGDFPNLVSLSAGTLGEGTTTYRGANGISGVGNYTIYYDAIRGVAPAVGGGGGGVPVVPELPEVEEPIIDVPLFNYFPFLFVDKFDSYDRDDMELYGDFFFGLFSVFGLAENEEYENSQDDNIRVEGDEILEESPGLFGLGPAEDESQEDDEEDKSGRYLNMQNTAFGQFWTYDLSTNEYSSFKVFGIPVSDTIR